MACRGPLSSSSASDENNVTVVWNRETGKSGAVILRTAAVMLPQNPPSGERHDDTVMSRPSSLDTGVILCKLIAWLTGLALEAIRYWLTKYLPYDTAEMFGTTTQLRTPMNSHMAILQVAVFTTAIRRSPASQFLLSEEANLAPKDSTG